MTLTIYHNPRCSKSRQTLAIIEAAGISPTIRLYLEQPMDEVELRSMLDQLGMDDPRALMRRGEAVYKELDLKTVEDGDALIAAMLAHPKLIERPIVSDGKRAVLGRPPEAVEIFF